MHSIEPRNPATILVCVTCRTDKEPEAGRALADATVLAAAEAPEIQVQSVCCLGNCARGLSAAIRCTHAWTYIFGALESTSDGPALVAGARLLAHATDGLLPWRGRPDSLKRGLIARVPPAALTEPVP